MKREIYIPDPHQIVAEDFMFENKRAGLFLGMSLSKTVIALSALYRLHYEDAAILKTLVIAPKRVAGITWYDELNKWDHLKDMRHEIIDGDDITRLQALRRPAEIYVLSVSNLDWFLSLYKYKRYYKKLNLPLFDCVVIDESSLFKNHSSKRYNTLKKWLKAFNVSYRYILTGTPSANGLTDLWTQMFLLDEGERLGKTWGAFIDKYFSVKTNSMGIIVKYSPRPGTAKAIAHKISDIVLSMETRDYLPDLVELNEIDYPIEFDPYDREIYETLESEYVLGFFNKTDQRDIDVTIRNALGLSNKLLQLTSGAIYDDEGETRELNTAKFDALDRLLNEKKGENFLVVYYFKHERDRLKKRYPDIKELPKDIRKAREMLKAWNSGNVALLMVHPQSAGHGLNMQFGGCNIAWLSLTWSLEYYSQTVARLLRRSQQRDVNVYRFIVAGTRDKSVADRVKSKEDLQNFIMREINELRRKHYDKIGKRRKGR